MDVFPLRFVTGAIPLYSWIFSAFSNRFRSVPKAASNRGFRISSTPGKLLKMSLSYIVAFAVKKYLKSLLDGESTDNYMFANYILAKEEAEGIIYWKLFWGVPKKLSKYLTFKDVH